MTLTEKQLPLTRRELRDRESARTRRSAPVPAVPAYSDASRGLRGLRHRFFSAAALLCAGALVVGTSIPAAAFFTDVSTAGAPGSLDGQSLAVSSAAEGIQDAARPKFTSESAAEVQARSFASSGGGSFTPTTGSVRWPFPFSTSITDGFGPRAAPCAGCSTFHLGTDFTPGEGVPTYSIAAGTVQSVIVSNAGLGNEVIIDHVIDGTHVTSVYGHLEMNSSPLKAGDTVKVGQMIGKVGSTGTVTGANMHLEIHVDGVPVDPFAWLTKNAR